MRVEFYSQFEFLFGTTLTMKTVLSFGLFVFLSSINYAQADTSIFDTWKIVSVKMAR